MRTWIVVPCFNEASRLDMRAFSEALEGDAALGLLFVNDGSTDGTLALLSELAGRHQGRAEVIDQQPNQGKAEAVRVGMLRAMQKGADYVGYFDADLATPLSEVADFARVLDTRPDVDIVLGARVALLGRDITRKASRHYLGRVFATAASLVLALPVYDTQCGAKLLRVTERTRALFSRRFGSRWIFDVELLARYLSAREDRGGLYEFPVRRWTDIGESRVRSVDFVRAIGELAEIYRSYGARSRHALGRAGEDGGVSAWLRLLTAPFIRYVGAGGIGTLIHYVTLLAVVEGTAIKPAMASMLGALVGALTNYVLNYHLTFASKMPHRRTLPRFLVVALLSMAISGAGMAFATEQLGMHYLVAQFGCTLVVLIMGYALNKAWTFAAPLTGRTSHPPGSRNSSPDT